MLLGDKTASAVAESIVRLKDSLAKKELYQIARARQIYANNTRPYVPGDMQPDLQTEYQQEWTPAAIGKTVANKLLAAMYGRTVERVVDIKGLPAQILTMISAWGRAAQGVYLRAICHGYVVIRLYPDWRQGVIHGIYDPDEATPIYDSETEALEPVGMIYHYKVAADKLPVQIVGNTADMPVLEYITAHERDRTTGAVINPGQRLRWFSAGSKWIAWPYFEDDEGLNPYGDYLGCVVWRNDDSANGPWGESDVLPIYELLQSVSHTCTDLKLLLKWNLWPPLFSNSPGFDKMPYSWRTMYGLAPDAAGNAGRIERLDWNPQSLTGGMDFLRLLLQLICESSSVPAISMGDLSGLGQLSSGRALEVVMMPLTDITNRRQKLQEWQEERLLSEMIVVRSHALVANGKKDDMKVMTMKVGSLVYPDAMLIPVSVSFGPLQLSRSTEDLISYCSTLYGAGLMSLDECMTVLHPEWNEKQRMEEVDKIKAASEPREGNVIDTGRTERIKALIQSETTPDGSTAAL